MLARQLKGGIHVAVIVVGQLLTLELSSPGDTRLSGVGEVQSRRLMWVFAVTQPLRQPANKDPYLGKRDLVLARQPFRDRGIVSCCQAVGLARKRPSHCF